MKYISWSEISLVFSILFSRGLQRYQRLKTEVSELASDVKQIQDSQKSSEKMLEVSPVDLAQDVMSSVYMYMCVYNHLHMYNIPSVGSRPSP